MEIIGVAKNLTGEPMRVAALLSIQRDERFSENQLTIRECVNQTSPSEYLSKETTMASIFWTRQHVAAMRPVLLKQKIVFPLYKSSRVRDEVQTCL
jgi:hypothetical protein